MLTPKFWMFCLALMVFGQIISMGISGDYLGEDVWDGISEELTGFSATEISGLGAVPIAFSGFITHGLPRMLTWNYAFLESSISSLNVLLVIIRCICVMIFSGGLVYGIVTQFQSYMIPALIGSGIIWGIGSLLS